MPTTSNRNLTFSQQGQNVTLNITYTANFNQLERNLANLGMVFQEQFTIVGVDPAGGFSGTDLLTVGGGIMPVTAGGGNQVMQRSRTIVLPRILLNEDPGTVVPDNDEIRVKIIIRTNGFPAPVTEGFTSQIVLVGDGGVVN